MNVVQTSPHVLSRTVVHRSRPRSPPAITRLTGLHAHRALVVSALISRSRHVPRRARRCPSRSRLRRHALTRDRLLTRRVLAFVPSIISHRAHAFPCVAEIRLLRPGRRFERWMSPPIAWFSTCRAMSSAPLRSFLCYRVTARVGKQHLWPLDRSPVSSAARNAVLTC